MHRFGQQAQGPHRRALDHAQGQHAVHHVQQFVAPTAQAVGLAQQFRGVFQHGIQLGAWRQVAADMQGRVVADDAGCVAQRIARRMRRPAAAAPRYI
ncbi:hypothetical protein D3C72_1753840 [compost metagenome]